MDRHNESQEIIRSTVAIDSNLFEYCITNNENCLSALQKLYD